MVVKEDRLSLGDQLSFGFMLNRFFFKKLSSLSDSSL